MRRSLVIVAHGLLIAEQLLISGPRQGAYRVRFGAVRHILKAALVTRLHLHAISARRAALIIQLDFSCSDRLGVRWV